MRKIPIILFVLIAFQIQAQTKYNMKPGYDIHVAGTSSLHDWEMTSDNSKGSMVASIESDKLAKVKELKITVVTESLKSGKSGMDKNAYEALKSKDNKEVTFTSTKVKVSGELVTATGELCIAGAKKNTTITATCAVQSNGEINCKGSKKIKMTEYNVDPPTAMFGTIKTGDDLEIVFDVTFTR